MAKRERTERKPVSSWIQMNETAIILALMVVSLGVLAMFILPDFFGLPDLLGAGGGTESANATGPGVSIVSSGAGAIGMQECLASHSVGMNTVVYIYSDTCLASQENTPWVLTLPAKGYNVFLANTANASAMGVVSSCLRDVASFGGTPEFVCPATRRSMLGAFSSEADLETFASACR